MILHYDISDIIPYINWLYFFHAWSMNGKPEEAKTQLRTDAEAMLKSWQGRYQTHAVFDIFEANSDGDDLIIGGKRIPMLRQQKPKQPGYPNLCLADFVRPISSGIKDKAGVFATSVDNELQKA